LKRPLVVHFFCSENKNKINENYGPKV